jgi:hypothetical protein
VGAEDPRYDGRCQKHCRKVFEEAGQTEAIGKAGVLEAKKHMLELLQAELEQPELEKPKQQY